MTECNWANKSNEN